MDYFVGSGKRTLSVQEDESSAATATPTATATATTPTTATEIRKHTLITPFTIKDSS
ncbi:MAG: hypothetical protein GX424_01240 [Clostridiales bacterium]|nr:hypothetical protein [Clostridiales bacterium]